MYCLNLLFIFVFWDVTKVEAKISPSGCWSDDECLIPGQTCIEIRNGWGLCGKAPTQIIKSNQEIIESEVTPPIPQTEISPNLKIELCLLTSMRSGSRPPAYPSMNIVIVNCGMGETCTPSNSEIFGNNFGMCTPTMESMKENPTLPATMDIRTPKMKPFLPKMIAEETTLAPETPMAPSLKIELCFMPGMSSRSRPPVNPSMNIVIVNCEMGETCTPSNSALFGNNFGMCTPKVESETEIPALPTKMKIRTPKMKPFLPKMFAEEQTLAPETPIAPSLKIELCIMSSMTSRSRPPVNPSMNIVIVNCEMGEACTPSNSKIFGNDFGICTPKMEVVEEIRTPKMKPFLGKMMAQEQNLAPETPIAPNLMIELCILPGMNVGRSRSPVNPSMKISIVNCEIGETCTPSNSELFGNAFGLCTPAMIPPNLG